MNDQTPQSQSLPIICGLGINKADRATLRAKNPNFAFNFFPAQTFDAGPPEGFPECRGLILDSRADIPEAVRYAQKESIPLHTLAACLQFALGQRTIRLAINPDNITDASALRDPEPDVTGDTLAQKMAWIADGMAMGDRSDLFIDRFTSIIFNSYSLADEKGFVQRVEQLIRYLWECGPLTEQLLKLCTGLWHEVQRTHVPASNQFYAQFAALLALVGRQREMSRLLTKMPQVGLIKDYPGLSRAVVDCVPSVATPAIKASAELYNRLSQNEKLFPQLVDEAEGRVAIVGNGPQALGQGTGREIDGKGLVVRFNTFDTAFPYCEDYGARTDVWVRMIPNPYVRFEPDNVGDLKQVMLTGANRLWRNYTNWDWVQNNMDRLPGLSWTPSRPYIELAKQLQAVPTSGLFMAYLTYLEIGPLPEGTVYASSFAEDSETTAYHYSDPNATLSDRHDMDQEREFFKTVLSGRTERSYYTPFARRREARAAQAQVQRDHLAEAQARRDALHALPPGAQAGQLWRAADYLREGGPVYTTSKGLVDYVVGGKSFQFLDAATEKALKDKKDPLVVGFGLRGTGEKALSVAKRTGVRKALAEYGLISGISVPSKTPFKFSLMLDDIGIFFDSTQPSRTQALLASCPEIGTPTMKLRARDYIDRIVAHNVVKYNDAPLVDMDTSLEGRNILVVDQTSGDLSISLGGCGDYSFHDIVDHALSDVHARVFVKLHPETVHGAKGANLDIERLRKMPRVVLIEENCNMMHLVKQMDEVFVMTSGAGIEALMAGIPVTTFGTPFYAGWGLTRDMQPDIARPRTRSLEEVVAAVFFQQTIWFDPSTRAECSAEEALRQLISLKALGY